MLCDSVGQHVYDFPACGLHDRSYYEAREAAALERATIEHPNARYTRRPLWAVAGYPLCIRLGMVPTIAVADANEGRCVRAEVCRVAAIFREVLPTQEIPDLAGDPMGHADVLPRELDRVGAVAVAAVEHCDRDRAVVHAAVEALDADPFLASLGSWRPRLCSVLLQEEDGRVCGGILANR